MDVGVCSSGEDIPGSGAMSLGSILGGSEGSIGMGSSSKGAMLVVLLGLANHCRRVLVARSVGICDGWWNWNVGWYLPCGVRVGNVANADKSEKYTSDGDVPAC